MPDFDQLQKLFDDALEISPEARDNFVRERCSAETANEVLALLDAHSNSEKYLTNVFEDMHNIIDGDASIDNNSFPSHIDHYQLKEPVGEGGMGVVFCAWDEKLQRTVAIKVLTGSRGKKGNEKERFIQEAKVAAQINHPNVCEVYEINETDDGQLYIVTAFCEGEDMAKAISSNSLRFGQILHIIIQLCEALSAAHQKSIFHRDIKPANIIIDQHHRVKLVDFGIAKISGIDLSQTGQIIGTFSHMAPEQFSGGHIDQRTDIWAIGVLLFESLTGSKPFVGDSPAAIMYQIFHGDFPNIESKDFPLANQLNQLLKRTINLDRQARFQSVEVLISELRSLQRMAELNNQLSFYPAKIKLEKHQNITALTSLTEYRKVVALGLRSKSDFTKNAALLSEIKKIIKNHKGQIVQRTESHVYAYFGFPLLREAHADHALACSIALCSLANEEILLKVALDYAPVVIKDDQKTGRKEIVGNIPWQFDALLDLNAPKKIVITEAVNSRLRKPLSPNCEWYSEAENFGCLYVLSTADEVDFVAYKERYRNPLTGRIHELGILEYTWRSVQEGESRTALVSGEAGMGKTRLIHELKQKVSASDDVTLIECQADPNQSETALHPIVYALKELFVVIKNKFEHDSISDSLTHWLKGLGLYSEENFQTLAWLIKLSSESFQGSVGTQTPEALHKKCLHLMEQCVREISHQGALLLILEDLHWADARTLDWLDSLLAKPIDGPVFLVLTGRPELFLRWRSNTAITQLALNKLGREESQDLMRSLCDKKDLPDDFQQIVLEKSAGNPLYVEEYTRMLLREKSDSSASRSIRDSIPDSIEDLVHAQLDYLGAGKVVAQAASVVGPTFDIALLPNLLNLDPQSCGHLLTNLVDAGIAYRKNETQYAFKHALIRDALLNSIEKSDKQKLHRGIALLYEKRDEANAEEIAFHLSSADENIQALSWWLKAAQEAQDRNAIIETIRLCRLGLSDIEVYSRSVGSKDDSQQRYLYERELQLQMILGPALIAVSNYANTEVGNAYARALELSEILEEEDTRFAAMMGRWSFLCVSAQHRKALSLAEMLIAFAEKRKSDDLRVEAYLARGGSHLFMAKLAQATEDLDKAIDCYDESMSAEHIRIYSQEPSMAIYTFRALLEEAKGDGEAAKKASKSAVDAGRRSKHPFSLGFSLSFAVHICLRQKQHALAMALRDEYKKLCEEQDIHVFKLLGAFQEGLFQIGSGKAHEGIETIEKAIPPYMDFGTGIFVATWYGMLAMSYLQLGNLENASLNLKKGYAQIEKTEEYLNKPILDAVQDKLKQLKK